METDRFLSHAFLKAHPRDAALILERLSWEESAAILEEAQPTVAAAALRHMPPLEGAVCWSRISPVPAGLILAALPADVAAGMLRRVDERARESLLAFAPAEAQALLRLVLRYPPGTAGALMDPQIMALPEDITVEEALWRVRRSPRHVFYYLYVVNRHHVLIGVLNLRELMLAPPKDLLGSVMCSEVARLPGGAHRASIASHPAWRDFHALPVIDDAGVFIGAIRYETLRQIEAESAAGRRPASALDTLLGLGRLYWVGMSALLQNVATALMSRSLSEAQAQEGEHGS